MSVYIRPTRCVPHLGLSYLVSGVVQTHILQQDGDVVPAGGGSPGQQHPKLLHELLQEGVHISSGEVWGT